MKIHRPQHNSTLVGFWIPSLKLFWASGFAHLPAYNPRPTRWAEVSKENWEKLKKDEDTQHPKA